MKILNKKYLHNDIEEGKYNRWLEANLFSGTKRFDQKVFSMILPPPNITGKLHLGHAWNNTLQDVVARYKKLQGYHVTWFPGMDHAGIATQVKVEARLFAELSKRKSDFTRSDFLSKVTDWKDEYMQVIHQQWATLGLALDYRYEKFTLDDDVSQLVNDAFIKLYQDGLIYKGKKIINWDPELQTALSNIEVIYKEVLGKMYYINYRVVNSNEAITIATTRPETMFADQALVFNPKDARFQKFLNQLVINPANGEMVPIIADEYVEIGFGTGIMKCTPAHDFNDYEIGLRHNLAMVTCMDEMGVMNANANQYAGLNRFECREKIVNDFKNNKTLIKVEDYTHQVAYSERSDAMIEPYLSEQWFIKMEPLANMVKKMQASEDAVVFYPSRFANVLEQWLDNLHDWCISRQLWWGHQLPVWYHKETKEMIVSSQPPDEISWIQDEDVLDTWFSSGLWPIVLSEQELIKSSVDDYLPSSLLVTGYDIIFFWITRMQFLTLYLRNKKPFNEVLIHGLIRDEQGKKMSKSVGNGIDPMDIINKYGTDSLRFFLLTNCSPGQDLRYSEIKIRSSWNFINKLWNASRYVLMNLPEDFVAVFDITSLDLKDVDYWILNKLNYVIEKVQVNLNNFEFVVCGRYLFDFVWDIFCSWYIELTKKHLANLHTKDVTLQVLFYVLKQIIILLHPLVPFVTEDIYQQMFGESSFVLQEKYPCQLKNIQEVSYFNNIINIIQVIREFKASKNIANRYALKFNLNTTNTIYQKNLCEINEILQSLTHSTIETINKSYRNSDQIISLVILDGTIDIFIEEQVDFNEQIGLITKEILHLETELKRSAEILNNEQFLSKAPQQKIAQEQSKYKKYQDLYKQLQIKLAKINQDK